MKNKIIALVLTFFAFNCEEPNIPSLEVSDPTPNNLENTLNSNSLSDIGSVDDYFYNFLDNVDAQFHKYTSFHLSGGVFDPDEDTLNFKTFPDFFVAVSPESNIDELTETIFDTTYQSVSQKDITFEINDPVSRVDSLIWEQVSGDEYRYVVYSTRLEKLTEPHDIAINDTFTNNFHQSIIDDIESNYIIIDTLEWDTTLTYNYFENSNILDVSNGSTSILDLGNNTSISYEFVIDTMVIVSSDSLMYKNPDGSIGDKMDSLLVSYIDEPLDDLNGNDLFDPSVGENFTDCNGNSCDGTLCNGDDGWDDSMGNGIYDLGEEFTDENNNNTYDGPTALFDPSSLNDCICSDSEVSSFACEQGEAFIDLDGDGVYDPPEEYTDINGNNAYDSNETFTDINGNDTYDTFVETQLTHIYPGDALITPGGNEFPLLDYLFDYSYYKTLGYSNINSVNEVVNNHIVIQDADEVYVDSNGNGSWDDRESFTDMNGNGSWDDGELFIDTNGNNQYDFAETFIDVNGNGIWDQAENVTEYKLAKTQTNTLDPATSLIEHEYNYHLLNVDQEGIKKFLYPSYFNFYGEWGIEDGENELYDFFGPDGQFGFWFKDEGVDEILFYLQGGENFRDGEQVQTFEIDTTDHAIYYITKDYIVERDTVSVPYKNKAWDAGVCMVVGGNNDGTANSDSQDNCISNGNLWFPEEDYSDDDANNAYTNGEAFIDGPSFIFKNKCFKITRVLSMEMKGTGVVYNERNITWLVKDLYIVKDEVSYSWGDQEWNPYSKILLSDFRNNEGLESSGNNLINSLLGNVKKVNLDDFDKHPETNFSPYQKVRSVGIQKIGTSY